MNGLEICNSQRELVQNSKRIFHTKDSHLKSYPNLECITTAFRNSVIYSEKVNNPPVPLFEQFCKAAVLYSDFYQFALGENFVCNLLRNDIKNNSSQAMEAWKRESSDAKSVEEFLNSQIKIHTLDKIRSNPSSAIIKFLWTVRTTNFIQYFIENLISTTGEDLHCSARDAYNKSLRPYHGYVKVGIAIMAFKLVPSKTNLILSLGYLDIDSGITALRKLSSASRPCIDQINALIEKYGCNFQNKV
ncbi:Glycolipid transfer protein (GLTP) [Cryptosporidium hominis]|uniref:Glycolipid transfer protein (GLTP) n=1 Tax=Cryptosporidium hominis TaxID=237895 RepID=A0ABX5BGK8_CRYHO|nr:glycolipid transfer protein [Cryptosporidium hominis TU502]PPS96849.1 Glycolipid transfer protein (GLTP) [Cryptosporidium hominis]|eukprot:PPS96849.1 Glycolipid transfer protein (GLTP) [Cryptosporidium hominis]